MNPGAFDAFGRPAVGTKPLRVVEYVSGSGTFLPLAPGSWCRVTQVGAGAGGGRRDASVGAGGGHSGHVSVYWTRVAAQTPYQIGAGGAGAALAVSAPGHGGATTLGPVSVLGGQAPAADTNNVSATVPESTGMAGPVLLATTGQTTGGNGGAGQYGGGGIGNVTGVPPNAATGYGSGGAGGFNVAGGSGTGGLIIIEEFGS